MHNSHYLHTSIFWPLLNLNIISLYIQYDNVILYKIKSGIKIKIGKENIAIIMVCIIPNRVLIVFILFLKINWFFRRKVHSTTKGYLKVINVRSKKIFATQTCIWYVSLSYYKYLLLMRIFLSFFCTIVFVLCSFLLWKMSTVAENYCKKVCISVVSRTYAQKLTHNL